MGVCVTVGLCEAVGLTVGVFISGVKTTTSVDVGKMTTVGVAVGSGGEGGVKKKLEINASRSRMPIMIGKAYLRSSIGKVVAGTTGSPAYPRVVNRLFKLAA